MALKLRSAASLFPCCAHFVTVSNLVDKLGSKSRANIAPFSWSLPMPASGEDCFAMAGNCYPAVAAVARLREIPCVASVWLGCATNHQRGERGVCVCMCVSACVRACVHARMHACPYVCVFVRLTVSRSTTPMLGACFAPAFPSGPPPLRRS